MYFHFLPFFLAFQLLVESGIGQGTENCSADHHHHRVIGSIGGVIEQSSRVGKEQKLAMEMAFQDIFNQSACFKLDLHFKDSNGSATRAASAGPKG